MGADYRIGTRGGTIEGEDAALEIFSEKQSRSLIERRAPPASRQKSDATQHLGL